jgi:16S rRNA (cytosine1402-N4)-methyltransferase
VVELLAAERGGFFVDATVGAGGHARALLEAEPNLRLLGLDRDPDALALARGQLAPFGERVRLVQANFGDLAEALADSPAPQGILADLGVSSMQLDEPSRGFSFRRDGPLDMRMSSSGRSAADIVAHATAEELSRIFSQYGEERMAIKIARAILEERSREPITTTRQLSRIVARVKGDNREKIDPATRVFQALRIEVNEELQALSRFLAAAVEKLDAGGRLGVVSYHSLEDRMVKETFRRESGVCLCPPKLPVCVCGTRRALEVLTRRPIRPSDAEVRRNPRSRSARLRVARKVEPERATL